MATQPTGIHAELQAVFDQHADPTHASRRAVHDQLSPIVRLSASVQHQILEYRTLIAEAEAAPHDTALDGKLEHMHQTLGAVEREAQAMSHAARELMRGMTQLDRYMAEWQDDIRRYYTSKAFPAEEAPAVPGAPPAAV